MALTIQQKQLLSAKANFLAARGYSFVAGEVEDETIEDTGGLVTIRTDYGYKIKMARDLAQCRKTGNDIVKRAHPPEDSIRMHAPWGEEVEVRIGKRGLPVVFPLWFKDAQKTASGKLAASITARRALPGKADMATPARMLLTAVRKSVAQGWFFKPGRVAKDYLQGGEIHMIHPAATYEKVFYLDETGKDVMWTLPLEKPFKDWLKCRHT